MPSVELVRFVELGHRGDDERAPRRARLHRAARRSSSSPGCYHGHADFLLVQAGSGVATLGLPDSPGVTAGATADTLAAPYNDLDAVERLFAEQGEEVAAVIVEPVAGNMGLVLPREGFLEGLRAVTERYGALLVFDEVMTGFRVHPGGAQALYGVTPDLTTLGKVIGGGLPVGAYGGRREIMELVAPAGPVYQAGTLSGNPLAMTAGIETLRALSEPGVWDRVEAGRPRLVEGIEGGRRAACAGARGNDVRPLLHQAPGQELGGREASRHDSVRGVPPRAARARRLPRPVPVRGRVRLDGARRGGDRGHRRGGPRGVRLARLISTLSRGEVLLVTLHFPPGGGGGVQRSLKLAQYLPALGIETHVLAPQARSGCTATPSCTFPPRPGCTASATSGRGR